jgi:ribosomal protein L10
MAITKQKKDVIMADLAEHVNSQKSVVIVSTKDTNKTIDASTNFAIRSSANKVGLVIKVVKNSLIEKNFTSVPTLSGQNYLAYLADKNQSDEVIVPKNFMDTIDKEFSDNFNIVGAIINGEFVDAATAKSYANIDSLDVSIAKTAGTINAIIAKIALTIKEIPGSTARAIGEVAKSK